MSKFCKQCGNALAPASKFCPNCGTTVPESAAAEAAAAPPPAQQAQGGYIPPVQQAQGGYAPPVQQAQGGYTPPVQQAQGGYAPPAQQAQGGYAPPVQQAQGNYAPPAQQAQGNYAPPAQQAQGGYAPPVQQAQGGYAPPVQQAQGGYAPPPQQGYAQAAYAGAAPQKQKKPIDKRVFIFGGAALAVILVAVLLVSLLGGKGGADKDDPNLGVWSVVSAEMWGMETDIADVFENGFTIELLPKGKCKLNIDGTKGSGKWSLEDGVFHIKGGGLNSSGTLKDGVLTLEDVLGTGLKLTFRKEGAQGGKPSASGADYFVIQSVTQAGESYDGDDLALVGFGDDYILLYPDGSADLVYFGSPFMASWKEGEITLPGMGVIQYALAGDELSFEPGEGMRLVYLRSSAAPPAALTQTTDVSGGDEDFVSPTTQLEPGSYWYGTTTISNYLPQSGAADAEGTYDVWGIIDTDDEGRPYFEIFEDAEMATVPLLSMYIKLFEDSFWAEIGEDDAWLFDIYLGTEAEWYFSPTLDNGALSMDYHCEGKNISFDIVFFLREDGAPWDEANDPLPPGYDEYRAGLGDGPAHGLESAELLSAAQLREAYDAMDPSGMTYEEVRDFYLNGVDGERKERDNPDIHAYVWRAAEGPEKCMYVSFKKNAAGKYVYTSRSINNIP